MGVGKNWGLLFGTSTHQWGTSGARWYSTGSTRADGAHGRHSGGTELTAQTAVCRTATRLTVIQTQCSRSLVWYTMTPSSGHISNYVPDFDMYFRSEIWMITLIAALRKLACTINNMCSLKLTNYYEEICIYLWVLSNFLLHVLLAQPGTGKGMASCAHLIPGAQLNS